MVSFLLFAIVADAYQYRGFHHSSRLHESFTVKQGQVHLTQLHTSYRLNHTQLAKKAILIQSDHEIVVYGVNRELHSDDGYLALPVDALGKEYYTISYAPSYYYTLFTVIGTDHHTNVAIQLPNTPGLNVTLKGITYHQNEWINLTLNIYSTLEISSVADLTGSHSISDKPVGVLSGNKKAVVGNTGGSRDHLVEMLLPVDSWGKNFATVPIPERHNVGDIFKFVASEDNTIITVTGMDHGVQFNDKFTIAKAGQSIQKHYSSGLYSHVVSDKPIALYQFSLTQKGGPDHADPSLITIPPIEQYAAHYTFTTPEYSLGNYTNYFMFIVNGNQKNGLRLDNHPLPSNTTYHKIPGSNLVAGYVGISVGTHTVNHINDTAVIGGILFGKAKLESYGFPVGLLLTPVNSPCSDVELRLFYDDNDDGDGRVDEDCRCCAPQVKCEISIIRSLIQMLYQIEFCDMLFIGFRYHKLVKTFTKFYHRHKNVGFAFGTNTSFKNSCWHDTVGRPALFTFKYSSFRFSIWMVTHVYIGYTCLHGYTCFTLYKFLDESDPLQKLFITTDSKQLVHVNISAKEPNHPVKLLQSFTVTQGQVHLSQLNTSFRLNHTQLVKKAILIQADHEIVVYGVNRELHSADGYLALPVDALGKEYYTISYSPSYYYTLFTVIGTDHHTNVAIQLPNTPGLNVTLKGITYHQNEWINLTLNIYSTLEISSVADLTGSHIISDKPVGVLSGNKKAVVGHTGKSRDHLVEMLLPVDSWGKNFVTVPIPERYNIGDIFKFVASKDNTVITVTGMKNGVPFNEKFTIAKAGQSIQKHYVSSFYSHVVSDKPIALYQFSVTQRHNGIDHADPSLITIPPIEQYAAHYTFTTPEYSLGNYTNYFMFVINGNQKNGLRLDNHPLPSNTTYHKIPGTNLVAGYVRISVGTHTVNHVNDTAVIGGILFGKATLESYGFPVGLLLTPVNSGCQAKAMDYGDEIDNDCDGEVDEEECDGKDDDGDGRVDEDCRCCAPQVVIGRRR
ncbi:Hypothetical predicted protein [Mytilus galloprovincialis]|uniref:IgGFc-binding protein N-terminal domain-containing protein n=1 Tax=Mytilus galloprovincialis TaxID=29158 RepID=A0A8B6C2N8_MYTGA|nr:Hypothetical predicted protein [Mytilus galloprovincialis]